MKSCVFCYMLAASTSYRLKLSTLQLHLPARALADSDAANLPCAYTLYAKHGDVTREGRATFNELSTLIRDTKELVLIIAAADVTILRTAVPPLSPAKLRAALPNLIEDKVLGDVADCVVAISSDSGGTRSIAVTRRTWLLAAIQSLRALGAQRISAVPEQLCLPYRSGRTSALISESRLGITLAIRTADQEGLGIVQHSAEAALHSLRVLLSEQAIDLFVSADNLSHYQALLAGDTHIQVSARNPALWQPCTLDLTSGLGTAAQADWHWQPWKWSMILATLLLLINTLALNLGWWTMDREATNLRASMKQIYLSAFPKETVILDPLLQMQQKIATAQRDTGLGATDDFTNLAAEFGQAWLSVLPAANSVIAGIEYREHSLIVRLKSDVPATAMQAALSTRNLSLETSANLTWQIRSKK